MRDFNEPLRRAGSDRISWSREIDLITFARGEEEEEEEGAERGATTAPSIMSASMSSCGAEKRIKRQINMWVRAGEGHEPTFSQE